MPKRLLEETERNFEPLLAEQPIRVLDEHIGGEFIAMQVNPSTVYGERAAVWNTRSRKVVWQPGDVNALCWTPDGKEVLLAVELYRRQPEKHEIIVTRLQSEVSHFLERRTWPEKKLISRCTIDLPKGWVVDLLASPTGNHVCCVWQDQHEAGIELFAIAGKKVAPVADRGYYGESNLLEGPVFSPDGRYLVLTYTNYAWWSPDDPETPSLGGQCKVGWIVVGAIETGIYREIEVHTFLAKSWLPPDPNEFCYVLFSVPSFTDRDHFKIVLPTGEERCFSVTEPGI